VQSDQCVVFDLDDTLYLERDWVRGGFEAVGHWAKRQWGVDRFGETCFELFEQGARRDILDRAAVRLSLSADQATIAAMVKVYRGARRRLRLAPDARRLLLRLQGRVRLGLISDGPLAGQRRKIEALGLARAFDATILTDRWGRGFWKPARGPFELSERLLGGRRESFIYVGDNPAKDFATPRQRGWRTVRIRRARGLHAAVDAAPPQAAQTEITTLDAFWA